MIPAIVSIQAATIGRDCAVHAMSSLMRSCNVGLIA